MAGAAWTAQQCEEWDEFVDEVVQVGGRHELRIAKRNLERQDGDWVDPMFFAEDYTVAAATGFQVWEGARAVAKLIGDEGAPLCARIKGKRVLELGSGTGLAGLCASVIGGDVIVSDLPTVTDYSLRPNIVKNASADDTPPPVGALLDASAWPGARRVGSGYVACMPLDWTSALLPQARAAGVELCKVEVVLAAECVWLQELVEPFVETVLGILEAAQGGGGRRGAGGESAGAHDGVAGELIHGLQPPQGRRAGGGEEAGEEERVDRDGGHDVAVCYCIYRDRAKDSSATFAGMAMVVAAFESRGCAVVLEQRLPPLEQVGLGGGGGDILFYRIQLSSTRKR